MSEPIFTPEKRFKANAEINVVPYIDVMLVLLVVFMITAPFITQGVDIQLPEAAAESIESNEETVVISMASEKEYFINIGENADKPISAEQLFETLKKASEAAELQVQIEADKALPYGAVVKLMSELQGMGITQMGLVTQPLK